MDRATLEALSREYVSSIMQQTELTDHITNFTRAVSKAHSPEIVQQLQRDIDVFDRQVKELAIKIQKLKTNLSAAGVDTNVLEQHAVQLLHQNRAALAAQAPQINEQDLISTIEAEREQALLRQGYEKQHADFLSKKEAAIKSKEAFISQKEQELIAQAEKLSLQEQEERRKAEELRVLQERLIQEQALILQQKEIVARNAQTILQQLQFLETQLRSGSLSPSDAQILLQQQQQLAQLQNQNILDQQKIQESLSNNQLALTQVAASSAALIQARSASAASSPGSSVGGASAPGAIPGSSSGPAPGSSVGGASAPGAIPGSSSGSAPGSAPGGALAPGAIPGSSSAPSFSPAAGVPGAAPGGAPGAIPGPSGVPSALSAGAPGNAPRSAPGSAPPTSGHPIPLTPVAQAGPPAGAAQGGGGVQGGPPAGVDPRTWAEQQSNRLAGDQDEWQRRQEQLKEEHLRSLQKQEADRIKQLEDEEKRVRDSWAQQRQTQLAQEQAAMEAQRQRELQEIEAKLQRELLEHGQMLEASIARRQQILEEAAKLREQELLNKQQLLSFKEEDLIEKERRLQLERQMAEMAKNRIMRIFIELTGPDGRKLDRILPLDVRAGDSLLKVKEKVSGYDRDLFKLDLLLNGAMMLADEDKSLLDYGIPDNSIFLMKLTPSVQVDVMNLIPCDECGKAFDREVFAAHKCMKGFVQELPSERRGGSSRGVSRSGAGDRIGVVSRPVVRAETRTVSRDSNSLSACEFCGGLFPSHDISDHRLSCPSRRGYGGGSGGGGGYSTSRTTVVRRYI